MIAVNVKVQHITDESSHPGVCPEGGPEVTLANSDNTFVTQGAILLI